MPATSPCAETSNLWARLAAFDLDGDAEFSFSRRLARDNGWTPAFARRVVLEYRKFIFLAAACGHPVTPSDEVDQAWHLHLVYTRSYWDELCGQVLGFPLHHGPTKGGTAEGHKFEDWYARTLQAYRAAFGTAPPADIWPPAAVRFGEAPHFRRVNVRRHILLPRPRWNSAISRRSWLTLAGGLVLMGCTARMPLNPLNWYGPEFLGLFWGLGLVLMALALWLRNRGRGPEEPLSGPPPGTYALARLADKGRLVADSALAALAHSGHVVFPVRGTVAPTQLPPPTDAYERSIWQALPPAGMAVSAARAAGLSTGNPTLSQLDYELESAGLLLPEARRRLLNRLPLLAALAWFAFGFMKLVVGIMRDKPVGILLVSMLIAGLVGVYWGQQTVWATGRGTRLLREAQQALREPRAKGSLAPSFVALSVALLGVSSLRALGLGSLATWLTPLPERNTDSFGSSDGSNSSDGGSDSSSGGDSGCSSGCGGCGGGGD